MTINPEQSMLYAGVSPTNDSDDKKKDEEAIHKLSLQNSQQGNNTPLENPIPKNDSQDDKDSEDKPLTKEQWWRAYGATLFVMGSVIHIVASIVTVVLFFISPFPPPLSGQSVWLIPVTGSIGTYTAFLIIALFYYPYIGTVKGASTRSYGQLRARLCQLHARLDALGILAENSAVPADKNFSNIAKVEAYRCYQSARWYLQEHRAGLRWVTGMGYINAWGLVHRAEEALVKIEPPEMVFYGAIHDRLAMLKSKIGKHDELLNKLTIAATQLYPEGEVYLRENTSDDSQRLQTIEKAVNEILAKHKTPQIDTDDAKRNAARLMLSEIRRTLNDYRDNIWASILHERNRLMNTIAITGLVTHILLCITIVIMIITKADKTLLMAATAYYVIGAIAGLFFRFWNEINSDNAPDDFGLSMARLLATPLLSGLAGIGGVIISLLLSDAITSTQLITFADMFQFRPGFFLTAAAFGLAPDLIIRGLQQKVARYSSDLSSSKSSGQGDEEE